MAINLLPIGRVERWILEEISKCIKEKFNLDSKILEPMELPKDAFDELRKQYNSTLLIHILSQKFKSRTLAITSADLYAENLNFIFGQAQLNGKIAIVSIARLDPKFYGEGENNELLRKRIRKEIVHELGHMFGLEHCKNKNCVMSFSSSVFEVDQKPEDFCEECKKKLKI